MMAIKGGSHWQKGKNPELRTLVFRLSNLYTKPFAVVFVGDGPERPGNKRDINVGKKSHWLTTDMKDLVVAFGFDWIEVSTPSPWSNHGSSSNDTDTCALQAPAEAEAELASMSQAGLIDAVLSDDGDTLMFGAVAVIRKCVSHVLIVALDIDRPYSSSSRKEDGDVVAIYRTSAIQENPAVQMTRGGMVLLAVLAGGDYHKVCYVFTGSLLVTGCS